MRFSDLLRLARQNLLRNRTRSLLTLSGVAVGVAALMALLSYGQALQKNARGEFEALELYHTLRVTSLPSPFNSFADVSSRVRRTPDSARVEVPITDSLMGTITRLPGVLAAYPEVVFPAKVLANGREAVVNAEAIPQTFAQFPGYQPTAGRFFASSNEYGLLIAPAMARRLGYARPEDALGDTVEVVTVTLHLEALQIMASQFAFGLTSLPFLENGYGFAVVGLLPEDGQPVSSFGRILMPQKTAEGMQKVTFFSTIDMLMRRTQVYEGYHALRVQVDRDADFDAVRTAIEEKGIYASAFRDQFAQLDRLFLIVDLALGLVGIIALLVATLGIANTMTMNVIERRGEIGVMKAIGGDERDLERLFIAESALLGIAGGLAGVVGGGLVMLLLQGLVSGYLSSRGLPTVQAFAPTVAVVLGTVAVAVAVSLVAGWAPARRAARIAPVDALRSL